MLTATPMVTATNAKTIPTMADVPIGGVVVVVVSAVKAFDRNETVGKFKLSN